jgi:cell wall-associated NlpC family hydrolase
MRIITFALAAVFVLLGSAQAQKSHTVKQGQTLSQIAAKYGVSQNAILHANKLSNAHKLKLGQKLQIPAASKYSNSGSGKTVAKNSVKKAGGGYVVRNGDHDWAISHKFGITVGQLHELNPGVNWKSLQIGQSLRVPGYSAPAPKLAISVKVKAGGSYAVREGDNDWIIARRTGTTPSKLRAINPDVKWTALQIGQKLRVPGGGSSNSGGWSVASYSKITTRHAVIAKDDVTIRRKPTSNAGSVTTVPQGTYVTVLDRESGWYKLQFPKGTVGWVRGDMLRPLASKMVARASSRESRTHNYVASKVAPVTHHSGGASLAVLDVAHSMLGVRYCFGAMSRSATDCSGMVHQAYAAVGIRLPRTSREMSHVGSTVSKGELRPGDLVFFHTRGSSRVNHVGIYNGNGTFIHASSGKGSVRIDTLNDGYYSRRFAGAKRVSGKLAPGKRENLVRREQDEQDRLVKQKVASSKGESEPAFDEPAKDSVGKDPNPGEVKR